MLREQRRSTSAGDELAPVDFGKAPDPDLLDKQYQAARERLHGQAGAVQTGHLAAAETQAQDVSTRSGVAVGGPGRSAPVPQRALAAGFEAPSRDDGPEL